MSNQSVSERSHVIEMLTAFKKRIVAGCAEKLDEGEVPELRLRLAALERLVVMPQS